MVNVVGSPFNYNNLITGPFNIGHGKNIFRHFLIPKLNKLLHTNGHETSLTGFGVLPFLNNKSVTMVISSAIGFVEKIKTVYINVVQGELWEERPDLYLGRLFSMFADLIYPADMGLVKMPSNETGTLAWALYQHLNQKLPALQHLGGSFPCLSHLGKRLLPQHYDILLDVIKHSQLGQTAFEEDNSNSFQEKFVAKAFNLKEFRKAIPTHLKDDPKLFEFCAFGSLFRIWDILEHNLPQCSLFDPTITGKGFCHTFNGVPMNKVFKPSRVVEMWNDAFNPNKDHLLHYPSGSGPNHGLTVVVNMFRTPSMEGTSKNMILSISNKDEWVNVFANHFLIQPGYAYTYKVQANQIIATKRFEELSTKDRNCFLPHETENMQFMKKFSKGGCLYECAVKQIFETCNCTTWNFPKSNLSNPPFCEEKFVAIKAGVQTCIDKVYSSFSANLCGCPSQCQDTTFTVFDNKESLESPGFYCNDSEVFDHKRAVYPYNIFCNLCRKMLKFYRILFTYKFLVLHATSPRDFPLFCNDFLMNNVAIIKVEMATSSLTQSVRDKRFNFEAQLSDLGEYEILLNVCYIHVYFDYLNS